MNFNLPIKIKTVIEKKNYLFKYIVIVNTGYFPKKLFAFNKYTEIFLTNFGDYKMMLLDGAYTIFGLLL